MKKLFTLAAAMVAATAIGNAQVAGYKINGTANGKDGSIIYLTDVNDKSVIDSAVVTNSAFTFVSETALNEPEAFFISLGRNSAGVFVDNGAEINVDLTSSPIVSDNGGYNDKLSALHNTVGEKSTEMRKTYGEMAQGGASKEELQKYVMEKQNEIMGIYQQAMTENIDNIYGAYVFAMLSSNYESVDELKADCEKVKYAKKFKQINEQIKVLENVSKTAAGCMFTDFGGTNIDGTPAKLSDHVGKGKYVLVDFWASWCGPCRREIPNLVELQNKFGGEKFTVLGVNVWDKEPEFKKALTSENINYPQLYASHNTDATTLYGIKGIPQIILFAPDGTIVQRDLRGEEMKALVAEKMAQ